ncbi:hypothetical protein BGZ98_006643 [Dissophora globulifera]|nr:hypothetical protein BGZ98_006643 [Dissophora globulifera]
MEAARRAGSNSRPPEPSRRTESNGSSLGTTTDSSADSYDSVSGSSSGRGRRLDGVSISKSRDGLASEIDLGDIDFSKEDDCDDQCDRYLACMEGEYAVGDRYDHNNDDNDDHEEDYSEDNHYVSTKREEVYDSTYRLEEAIVRQLERTQAVTIPGSLPRGLEWIARQVFFLSYWRSSSPLHPESSQSRRLPPQEPEPEPEETESDQDQESDAAVEIEIGLDEKRAARSPAYTPLAIRRRYSCLQSQELGLELNEEQHPRFYGRHHRDGNDRRDDNHDCNGYDEYDDDHYQDGYHHEYNDHYATAAAAARPHHTGVAWYHYLNPGFLLWWILKNITALVWTICFVVAFDLCRLVYRLLLSVLFLAVFWPWSFRNRVLRRLKTLCRNPFTLGTLALVAIVVYARQQQGHQFSTTMAARESILLMPAKSFKDSWTAATQWRWNTWDAWKPRVQFSQIADNIHLPRHQFRFEHWILIRKPDWGAFLRRYYHRGRDGTSHRQLYIPEYSVASLQKLESRIELVHGMLKEQSNTEIHLANQVASKFFEVEKRVTGAESRLETFADDIEALRQQIVNDGWIEQRVAKLLEDQYDIEPGYGSHQFYGDASSRALPALESRSLTMIDRRVIQDLIDEALEKYAADVLAKPDYALHSAGGRIIPEQTFTDFIQPVRTPTRLGRLLLYLHLISEQPPARQRRRTLSSEELEAVKNHAEKAIQPDMHVGDCWAMQGNRGQIAVLLSKPIIVTDVSIEHVDPRVALDDRSAPREMELWRLDSELTEDETREWQFHWQTHGEHEDTLPLTDTPVLDSRNEFDTWQKELWPPAKGATLLTQLEYRLPVYPERRSQIHRHRKEGEDIGLNEDLDDDSSAAWRKQPKLAQTFRIARSKQNVPSHGIVMRIVSNWGHPEYTCLYRLRVHGYEPTKRSS